MNTSVNCLRNRALSCSNVKKIHNYSYFTDRVIGSGNFSTVYEAFSHTTHEKIAVKVVKMSSLTFKKLEQLLNQQIQILLTLNHMNTIKCFDVLKTLQQCYIFTELCEGGTLDNILKQRGAMNQQQAWPFIEGIFKGLKYLNQRHIIHRDLKPANIFLKGDTVKIADFGFAVQASQSFKDMNIGSPFYMSPEAFLSNLYGRKTDVWSFGIIMYELLHGKTPFSSYNDPQSLKARIILPIKAQDFRPDISFQLRELIIRCLQIDQSQRISIAQIEQSNFMKSKSFVTSQQQKCCYSYLIQPETHRLENSGQADQKIIRIPSKITIKERYSESTMKQNNQPQVSPYPEVIKVKSNCKRSQHERQDTLSTRTDANILEIKPAIYKISNQKLKDYIKTISYESYLKQSNNKISSTIVIK